MTGVENIDISIGQTKAGASAPATPANHLNNAPLLRQISVQPNTRAATDKSRLNRLNLNAGMSKPLKPLSVIPEIETLLDSTLPPFVPAEAPWQAPDTSHYSNDFFEEESSDHGAALSTQDLRQKLLALTGLQHSLKSDALSHQAKPSHGSGKLHVTFGQLEKKWPSAKPAVASDNTGKAITGNNKSPIQTVTLIKKFNQLEQTWRQVRAKDKVLYKPENLAVSKKTNEVIAPTAPQRAPVSRLSITEAKQQPILQAKQKQLDAKAQQGEARRQERKANKQKLAAEKNAVLEQNRARVAKIRAQRQERLAGMRNSQR